MKNIKWKGKCKCKFDLSFAGLEQMKVKVLVNIVKKFLKKESCSSFHQEMFLFVLTISEKFRSLIE